MMAGVEPGAHIVYIQKEWEKSEGDMREVMSKTDLLVLIYVALSLSLLLLLSTKYPVPIAVLWMYGTIIEEIPLGL